MLTELDVSILNNRKLILISLSNKFWNVMGQNVKSIKIAKSLLKSCPTAMFYSWLCPSIMEKVSPFYHIGSEKITFHTIRFLRTDGRMDIWKYRVASLLKIVWSYLNNYSPPPLVPIDTSRGVSAGNYIKALICTDIYHVTLHTTNAFPFFQPLSRFLYFYGKSLCTQLL